MFFAVCLVVVGFFLQASLGHVTSQEIVAAGLSAPYVLDDQINDGNKTRELWANSRPSSLLKRDPRTFDDWVDNGICMMAHLEEQDLSQSVYTDPAKLLQDGWVPNAATFSIITAFELEQAGWNTDDFQYCGAKYPQDWVIPGYAAKYEVFTNIVVGVIVVADASAPIGQLVNPQIKNPPNTPPVSRLSDITWLCWQSHCNTAPDVAGCLKNLKFVIHRLVVNPDSEAVAQQIMGTNNNYPPWPGRKMDSDSPNGYAMIGCPNGYGVAYLLAQHSDEDKSMGRKPIDYVWLYGPTKTTPSFVFHITDSTDPGQNAVAIGKDSSMSMDNSSYSMIQDGPGMVNG